MLATASFSRLYTKPPSRTYGEAKGEEKRSRDTQKDKAVASIVFPISSRSREIQYHSLGERGRGVPLPRLSERVRVLERHARLETTKTGRPRTNGLASL